MSILHFREKGVDYSRWQRFFDTCLSTIVCSNFLLLSSRVLLHPSHQHPRALDRRELKLDRTTIDHRRVKRLAKIDPIVDTGLVLDQVDQFERIRTVFALRPAHRSVVFECKMSESQNDGNKPVRELTASSASYRAPSAFPPALSTASGSSSSTTPFAPFAPVRLSCFNLFLV